MAGMDGWQGWEMRKSEHLDSQTTAPCLYSRHVLDSIITGPRADGQTGTRVQYLSSQPASQLGTVVGPTTCWLQCPDQGSNYLVWPTKQRRQRG